MAGNRDRFLTSAFPLVGVAALALGVITGSTWSATQAKLLASDSGALDRFGTAVSISGNRAIVGAYLDDHSGFQDAGSAYVFHLAEDGTWYEFTKIIADDAFGADAFGWSAAISGDIAIVGAPFDDDMETNSGSVYVFQLGGNTAGEQWDQVAKIKAADPAVGDRFGVSVSIEGDLAIVGCRAASPKAFVFGRNQGGKDYWGQARELTASDGEAGDGFGGVVSISGDTAVVGAGLTRCAYVFQRDLGGSNNWGQVKKITAPDPVAADNFGNALAIDADVIIIGAIRDDDACPGNPNCNSGAAYIFHRDEGGMDNWGLVKKIRASDAFGGSEFGVDVAMDGDQIIVGSWHHNDRGTHSGSAYLFERDHGGLNNWGETEKLFPADGNAHDELGRRVSIDAGTPLVGAWRNGEGAQNAGAAYVFSACPADLTRDDTVGIADLLDLIADWGTSPGGPPDLDGNGLVGFADLLLLFAEWGPCS